MFGTYKKGFTLIEILVAIAIIAVMATVVIPNLMPRRPEKERKDILAKLDALTRLAWYNALTKQKTHKVLFDFDKKRVSLEVETDKKDSDGNPLFEPVKTGGYIKSSFVWPKHLDVKNFYVEGFDEIGKRSDRGAGQVWFFVIPDGLAQQVTINFLDMLDRPQGKPRSIGLVLNPFLAQFKEYDTFQK